MRARSSHTTRNVRQGGENNAEIKPTEVVPFGRYGAGIWTSHPVGLVAVLGVLLIGLIALPEARIFLACGVGLGVLFGFILWLMHR